ncbi:MAG: glycine cleavage T C-terminal barrel domain-containing protein, partial [Candidatus Saccharimonadales bacterium]
PLTRRLVGFVLPRDYTGPLPSECHLVIERGEIAGRVTSIARSPALGQAIGLAYVRPSQAAPGVTIEVRLDSGRLVAATVVDLPFYDRQNARQVIGEREGGTMKRAAKPAAWIGPIQEQLEPPRPESKQVAERRVALRMRDEHAERAAAATPGICDVSALARLVVKGPAAAEFLANSGLTAPSRIYEHHMFEDGGLCVRTGGAEFFVEDGWQGTRVERLQAALTPPRSGVLSVWRQDVSLVLMGCEAAALLAQVCSFDFAQASEQFVMTQIAGVSCSVLRRKLAGVSAWQLWADGTYGAYLWHTLLTIAREMGGDAVGTECLGETFLAGPTLL